MWGAGVNVRRAGRIKADKVQELARLMGVDS